MFTLANSLVTHENLLNLHRSNQVWIGVWIARSVGLNVWYLYKLSDVYAIMDLALPNSCGSVDQKESEICSGVALKLSKSSLPFKC
ncbi:hypothetical protein VNO77_07536 [Canavalia gladiata]|uniref:Uncharacterized protein n=1 Tax=Canavalia gladiata TaxID=3824 RepID=A0AAN9QVV4_CANGL